MPWKIISLKIFQGSHYHHQHCKFESCSGEVYSIQHHVIDFVSESGFHQVLRFPPLIKLINATFYNISVILLLVKETGAPGENHWPAGSHWQTLSLAGMHHGHISIYWGSIKQVFKYIVPSWSQLIKKYTVNITIF